MLDFIPRKFPITMQLFRGVALLTTRPCLGKVPGLWWRLPRIDRR